MSKDIHLDTKQGIQIKEREVLLYFHINRGEENAPNCGDLWKPQAAGKYRNLAQACCSGSR
jgi:hypothetical protein